MQKNHKIMLGALLAAVLFIGASIALIVDIFLIVPDFTALRSAAKVPIRLANGDESFRMIGPKAPGWVPLHSISKFLPRAIVASEDASFYSHDGIDVHEIKEALKKDWEEKRFARGASTLTQQVLKNVFLGKQKTIWRKVKEIIWARELEKVLSKGEIIQYYMNMAEWGPGIYGVQEAAQHYFSEKPDELTARQAAFLTMLLPSPRRYHSYFNRKQLTEWASKRVDRILEIMFRMGFIDEPVYSAAVTEELWGVPAVPDTAPGVPLDPGNVTELPNDEFESPSLPQDSSETKGKETTVDSGAISEPAATDTPSPVESASPNEQEQTDD